MCVRRGTRFHAVLVALAVLLRAGAVLVLQSHHVPRSTYEHGEIAANLLAGRGFTVRFLGATGPTSQQAPVYPALVALAYAAGGVETPRALLILELCQAALGGLLVLGTIRLARAVAPNCPAVSLGAGFIAAVHPTLVYAATHVQVSGLAATLVVWVLAWAHKAGADQRAATALLTGLLLALLVLCDPILALVAPGALWMLGRATVQRGCTLGQAARLASLVLLTAGVGIAPWMVRNARVHGEFVAIKSTFGYAFWQGNCALSEGTDKVVRQSVQRVLDGGAGDPGLAGLNRRLWAARHEAGYIDDIALSRADIEELAAVSEPERSRILWRRAIAELSERPGRYPGLCLRRLRYFWIFDETNPKTRVWVYRASHLALLSGAIAGLALAASGVRRRLWPLVATALVISAFHALTIVSARFHIPIEPLMAVWAGAGLSRWSGQDTGSGSAAGDHVVGVGLKGRLGVRRELVHGETVRL